MTMLEKINAMKIAQDCKTEICEKLREVIKNTYSHYCDSVDNFDIFDENIGVEFENKWCGYYSKDYVIIPIAWLAEDFDYKSVYEEQERKRKLAAEAAEKERAKKRRALKEAEERKLYTKLKKKYGEGK